MSDSEQEDLRNEINEVRRGRDMERVMLHAALDKLRNLQRLSERMDEYANLLREREGFGESVPDLVLANVLESYAHAIRTELGTE